MLVVMVISWLGIDHRTEKQKGKNKWTKLDACVHTIVNS